MRTVEQLGNPRRFGLRESVDDAHEVVDQCGAVVLDVGRHDYAASALRRSPTFQAVTRSDSFRGAGRVPFFTMRQMVADEQPTRPSTTGWRTFAESGSESKFFSASGIALGAVRCAIPCNLVIWVENGTD